jgi:hypothetical protein
MMTHRMMIRRQLRSARVSALTSEERRQALLVAERAAAQKGAPAQPDAEAAHGSTPGPQAGTS